MQNNVPAATDLLLRQCLPVQDEFQDRVNITPADVDAEMARQNEGADKTHFLVSVIFGAFRGRSPG